MRESPRTCQKDNWAQQDSNLQPRDYEGRGSGAQASGREQVARSEGKRLHSPYTRSSARLRFGPHRRGLAHVDSGDPRGGLETHQLIGRASSTQLAKPQSARKPACVSPRRPRRASGDSGRKEKRLSPLGLRRWSDSKAGISPPIMPTVFVSALRLSTPACLTLAP
jgi:hypothetical protein